MTQKTGPKARKNDLSITTIGDETVVFDRLSNKASCLNAVTTTVWQACDGDNNNTALLDALKSSGFQDATEETVWMALDQLDKSELLDVSFDMAETFVQSAGRREMLLSLAKRTAIAIPVVTSIEILPPLAAASCLPLNAPCSSGDDCCSGSCNGLCT